MEKDNKEKKKIFIIVIDGTVCEDI